MMEKKGSVGSSKKDPHKRRETVIMNASKRVSGVKNLKHAKTLGTT